MASRTENFLFGMVQADFFPYENYERDYDALLLAEKIRKETDRPLDQGVEMYTGLVQYTLAMRFNWEEGVPDEYKALEQWWKMMQAGNTPGVCYQFYITEVANAVTSEWSLAKINAHRPWKPVQRRPPNEQTDEERADPN